MENISLTINGRPVTAQKGQTVLEAALASGIYIPTLCYYPDLKPYGGCRLCIVEIEGMRGFPTSCTTPAVDGMKIFTETEAVNHVRRTAVELLIAEHPSDCLTCSADQRCELQKVAAYLGIKELRLPRRPTSFSIDSSNPFFNIDRNKCILCGRCTRTCNEITCVGAIDLINRGASSRISTFDDIPIFESVCQSCGECVARCPVGALSPKKALPATSEVASTCPYCGTGCSLFLGVRDDKIVSVRGNPSGPANKGNLCVKGRFGIADFVHSPARLKTPLIKKNGKLEPATWDEALDLIARNLVSYPPSEVAVVSSSRATNEANYVAQKLARAVLHTNNVDNCARVCHGPSVAGLANTFGSGAMTNYIEDIPNSACILAIGTNATSAHPIISFKIKQAVRQGSKLIVVNPRETPLSRLADIWLRLNPGTDVALLMGMMRIILEEGLQDLRFISSRCENFEVFQKSLVDLSLNQVEKITGVSISQIAEAARMYATFRPSSVIYTLGITEHTHGTDNVMALADLAMLVGNMGLSGGGVNPLRGQNNVQGACDMGALPGSFPGYQGVANPDIRKKFETAWNVSLNPQPGLMLTEMYIAAHQKQLKAIYLVGEDPVLSEPDMQHTIQALQNLDFLVVQDIFLSETAKLADVVLPAAGFAAEDGTYTNTERRVQRVRKAVPPPGEALPDWEITCLIGRKMGQPGFAFQNAEEIWLEMASLSPIMNGISYDRLDQGGLQWPCPTAGHPGTPILHTKTFTRGKGNFVPLSYRPPAELPDADYPLILMTERSLFHYHTGTMTRQVAGLNQFKNEELVEINPDDAVNLGIRNNDWVTVSSRRGSVFAKARVTTDSPPGAVSMTFHFSECPTNALTSRALDPIAKTPELKFCAVRVVKKAP